MIELSIAIQHTPSRADRRKWVQAMLNQLRIENPNMPIALIEDTQHGGCWPTYRRALEADSEVSHHLVLQDDLGLCKDFIQSVKEVIRARPNNTATAWQEFSTSSNLWAKNGQELDTSDLKIQLSRSVSIGWQPARLHHGLASYNLGIRRIFW